MFSTGKDSCVMMDLMMKHYKGEMKFCYLYFVPNLSYKEDVLTWYEKRYGITIDRKPSPNTLSLMTGKKITQSAVYQTLRKEYDIAYLAQGVRRDESLARRGMLAHIENGIDERNKYLYPVADFSTKQVWAYIKINKLKVGAEYQGGYKHDLSVMDAEGLLYIKNQFPQDYQKIIAAIPRMEDKIKRLEFYGR